MLRRLVYGEPIGDDHVIVDEETLKELKRRQQRKKELNHMATPQELEVTLTWVREINPRRQKLHFTFEFRL